MESFWGFAKTRLARFRGLPKDAFLLHLKECEFRFNHWHEDFYPLILKMCQKNPLS
jgi:transposase-like protein